MEVKPEALVQATFKFFQKNPPGLLLTDRALSLPRLPASPSHPVLAVRRVQEKK